MQRRHSHRVSINQIHFVPLSIYYYYYKIQYFSIWARFFLSFSTCCRITGNVYSIDILEYSSVFRYSIICLWVFVVCVCVFVVLCFSIFIVINLIHCRFLALFFPSSALLYGLSVNQSINQSNPMETSDVPALNSIPVPFHYLVFFWLVAVVFFWCFGFNFFLPNQFSILSAFYI